MKGSQGGSTPPTPMLKVICESGAKVFGKVINMSNVSIELVQKTFDKNKEKYIENYHCAVGLCDRNEENYLIQPHMTDEDQAEFDGDSISLSAELFDNVECIGNIHISIPITTDIAIAIIAEQVRKYNKIKAVLEATK